MDEDAALDALWQHAKANWESDAAHEALLGHCQSPRQLAVLARRYRDMGAEPKRAERAERQLKLIASVAMAQLHHGQGTNPVSEALTGWKIALAVLLLAAAAALATQL